MPTIRPRTTQYLWEFLLELLDGNESCSAISWINRERGEFVLKDQSMIAKLWGKVKGRPRMDKIKLGRAMRYYYKKKLLAKVPKRKAVYRFINLDSLRKNAAVAGTMNDIQEIDFSEVNTLNFIEDTDTTSLSSFNDDDDIDTPLENLLLKKCGTDACNLQNHKCQKLQHMGESTFYNDFNNNGNCNEVIDYNNYNSDCSTYTKNEDIGTFSHSSGLPSYSNAMETTANQYTTNNNCFTSLLVKSMLMCDDLTIEQQTDNNEQTFYEDTNPVTLPMFSNPTKSEHVVQQSTPFYSNNVDLTLNALKDFESIVMLNSLVHV